MKTINVKKSVYSKEDKLLLNSAIYRKVLGEVIPEKKRVIVRVGLRTVGVFTYDIDKKICNVKTDRIIESEWNSQILAIHTLSNYFKKTKEADKIQWVTQ